MNPSKRGRPPASAKSIKQAVFDLFAADPDKEWSVVEIVDALQKKSPGINEASIRFMVSELKKGTPDDLSKIKEVRRVGHHQVLKFCKPGEGIVFPRNQPAALVQEAGKAAQNGSPSDLASDLATLEEAAAVILKLQALVRRNQEVLATIARLKSVL